MNLIIKALIFSWIVLGTFLTSASGQGLNLASLPTRVSDSTYLLSRPQFLEIWYLKADFHEATKKAATYERSTFALADTVQVLISGLKTQEALNAALFTMVQDQNTENLSLKRDIKAANRREVNQKTIKNIAIGGGATLSAFFGLLYLLK